MRLEVCEAPRPRCVMRRFFFCVACEAPSPWGCAMLPPHTPPCEWLVFPGCFSFRSGACVSPRSLAVVRDAQGLVRGIKLLWVSEQGMYARFCIISFVTLCVFMSVVS